MKRFMLCLSMMMLLTFAFVWQGVAQAHGIAAGSPSSVIKPTEEYLVPVNGPNLTGQTPPLDRSKAIALHQSSRAAPDEVPGQWYDHYAYYDLGSTQVEQYTNFRETDYGQYIWLQRWKNNNGGANRWLADAWTGTKYSVISQWLSGNPSLSPAQEFTQGNGTSLQSYFKTNDSSCPCWQAQYTVGTH